MAKQGIRITDCPICRMSVYHIHTLQTGGCGPRPIKFSDKNNISGGNTDTEQVNAIADSSSQKLLSEVLSLWVWGVLGNSIS